MEAAAHFRGDVCCPGRVACHRNMTGPRILELSQVSQGTRDLLRHHRFLCTTKTYM